MKAWYYYRGRLTFIPGEHPGVAGAIYRGKARVRYHEDTQTLAVQGRSRRIVRAAVSAYYGLNDPDRPEKIEAEWPGHYVSCFANEFNY